MKKLFSLLLVVALVAIMATGAYASDASTSVSVSNSAPAIGDTITVNVGISNNPGFCTGTLTISYDSSVLELVDLAGVMFNGYANPATGMVNTSSIEEIEGDGTLATATFKVIGSGDTSISASVVDMTDYDFAPIGISGSSASVSVAAPHEHAFGNEWKYDEDCHWRECECGEITDFDEHDMVDGVCSVCGYEEEVIVPTEKPADPEPTKKPVDPSKSPQTGDFIAFALIAVVCAAAVVVIVSSKKSKAQK